MKKDTKPNVRVLILKNHEALLLGRENSKEEFRYELAGGNVEPGHTHKQTGVLEAKQETGLDVIVGKLFCKFTNEKSGVQNWTYFGKLIMPYQRIILEEGFTEYLWFDSSYYKQVRLNPSTKYVMKKAMQEGYIR